MGTLSGKRFFFLLTAPLAVRGESIYESTNLEECSCEEEGEAGE